MALASEARRSGGYNRLCVMVACWWSGTASPGWMPTMIAKRA